MDKQLTRCGFVALIGAPNAGKSTITNDFVGSKVSIVSPKVQTTRSLVRGIGIFENTQIIFTHFGNELFSSFQSFQNTSQNSRKNIFSSLTNALYFDII